MTAELPNDRYNQIMAKPDFAESLTALRKNNPDNLLNWPEAAKVFSELDREMQATLVSLAQKKDPIYTQGTIECLASLGIILNDPPKPMIKKDMFAEWILLHHTNRGKISKPVRGLAYRGAKSKIRSRSSHPGWLVSLAILSLGLPIVFMLIPLLNLPMPVWVEQLFGDDQKVDPFRDVGLFLVLITVGAYLFFWLTRHSMVNGLKLILGVVAISLAVLWLGFPLYLVILFALVSFFDLLGLFLIYLAYRALPPTSVDSSSVQLREKLRQVVDPKEWENLKKWSESRLILTIVLTLTGLLFFSFIVMPREYPLSGKEHKALVLAPSWLSYRDEGTIVMATQAISTTLVSGIVELEPGPGSLIQISPLDQESCSPECDWGPLSSTIDRQQGTGSSSTPLHAFLPSEYEVLEWRMRTAPRSVFSVEPKWHLRLQICQQIAGTPPSCIEPQTISINRIRIGFRLWGFLEEQPLVNIMSIVFGIVYAVVQILVSNLFIF